MENLVSPLIKPQPNVAIHKPLLDDPYAHVTHLEELKNHHYSYITRKIEQNWITSRDIELIKFVNVHRWTTQSQISRLFFLEAERVETIRRRINNLLKYGLLRKVKWASYSKPNDNRPSLYELGDSGADILKYKCGIPIGQRDPRKAKPSTMLFRLKYVVTNELYIHLRNSFDLVHFEYHPLLVVKEETQVPMAKYILRNSKGRDMPFYLINHRDEEKWVKTIRYQARFYKEYILSYQQDATLVVHVSTDDKAELASKIVEQEGASSCTWFITDKDIYSPDFNIRKGFFVYQNGKKIYYDLQ